MTKYQRSRARVFLHARRYDRQEVVAFLLSHDPTIVASGRALREATKAGRVQVAALLLDAGTDAGAIDPEAGDTALHAAARFSKPALAELLLKCVGVCL
jgi:ankyrin repeat protein